VTALQRTGVNFIWAMAFFVCITQNVMSKKVGILGTGVVGQVLAQGFLTHGYSVMVATRDPEALAQKGTWDKAIHIGTHRDVAQWADLLVLATKGSAAEGAIRLCDSADLAGKVIIDTTNPIADAPPTAGVLHYFTTLEESLMERHGSMTVRSS